MWDTHLSSYLQVSSLGQTSSLDLIFDMSLVALFALQPS